MSTKKKVKVSGKSAFFTRKIANEGVRFPLCLVTGEETEEWLLLRNTDSEVFEKASLEYARRQKDIEQIEDEGEKRQARKIANVKMTASLVAGWSFPEPCTFEGVVEMLNEAPYLVDSIDRVTFNRQLFYGGASSNSPVTPKPPTDSASPQQKDQVSPAENT